MGDGAPDAVVLTVDVQDADRHPRAAGRPAPGRIAAQAVDAAVQGDEHAVEVHQADGAHVAAAHAVFLKRLLIEVLAGLLHRGGDAGTVPVGAVHLQHLHQHSLAGLIVGAGVDPALIGELLEGNVGLGPEQVHEDTGPNDGDDPGLGADTLVNLVVPSKMAAKKPPRHDPSESLGSGPLACVHFGTVPI